MLLFTRALTLLLTTTSAGAFVAPKSSSFIRHGQSPLSVSISDDVSTKIDVPEVGTEDCVTSLKASCDVPFFNNVMAANRAEIAVRIMRAATEMNSGTVAIYGHEDRYSQHRWGADRSYKLEKASDATPISAYLDIPQIIKIAKEANVDAIHPGYVACPL